MELLLLRNDSPASPCSPRGPVGRTQSWAGHCLHKAASAVFLDVDCSGPGDGERAARELEPRNTPGGTGSAFPKPGFWYLDGGTIIRFWSQEAPAAEALQGFCEELGQPLTSLPQTPLTSRRARDPSPVWEGSPPHCHLFPWGETYLAVLGDQLGRQDLQMGLRKNRLCDTSRVTVLGTTKERQVLGIRAASLRGMGLWPTEFSLLT